MSPFHFGFAPSTTGTVSISRRDLIVRELLRVAEHGDGWGVPADWE